MRQEELTTCTTSDASNTRNFRIKLLTNFQACTGKVSLKVGRWKLTEAANKAHAAAEAALSSESSKKSSSGATEAKLQGIVIQRIPRIPGTCPKDKL